MISSQAGTYQMSAPVASPSSDWTVQQAGPATLTTNAPGQTSMIAVKLAPKSSGGQYDAVDGELSFTITSADGTHSLPFNAHLRVIDVMPDHPRHGMLYGRPSIRCGTGTFTTEAVS